jgi:Cu/Zn superoxide dismutase
VSGTVIFEQESESSPTVITWDITGNDPNAKRGFHIHTFGDNTNGCTSAGPHCEFAFGSPLRWSSCQPAWVAVSHRKTERSS